MNIHILYSFKKGPWGGGNQFLKALKKELVTMGAYSDEIQHADVVLFNSFQDSLAAIIARCRNPQAVFVHRVDGPVLYVRGTDSIVDKKTFAFNALIADATVFQSQWCREMCIREGLTPTPQSTVIYNAPDAQLFTPKKRSILDGKIKLVATSWSSNMRKGFEYYKALDEQLDFDRYTMTFVGNSPISFKNIAHKKPMSSKELSHELRQHDIYITASQTEPCSNALIEALASGLPAVAHNSGGHPELVQKGGVLFSTTDELLGGIDEVVQHYEHYTSHLPVFDSTKTAQQYLAFAEETQRERRTIFPLLLRFLWYAALEVASRIMRKFKLV